MSAPMPTAGEKGSGKTSMGEIRETLRSHQLRQHQHHFGLDEGDCDDECCLAESPDTGELVYRVSVTLGSDYLPEDVQVRVDPAAGTLVVEAEHCEVQPGSRIQRRLKRSFQPPAGTDLGRVVTRFSAENGGRLELEAPFFGHPVTRYLLPSGR